jgi:YHS domain-containing protein
VKHANFSSLARPERRNCRRFVPRKTGSPTMLKRVLLLFALLWLVLPAVAAAQEFNVDSAGLALRGYDPVAYFTAGKPEAGRAEFTATHKGASYRFASAANRDAFIAAPDRYLPQYGGWCAFAAAGGKKSDADPQVWRIENGKLYLNYNRNIGQRWSADIPGFVSRADARWPEIREKSASDLR